MLAVFLMRLAPEDIFTDFSATDAVDSGRTFIHNIVVIALHVYSGHSGRHSAKWTASLRSWTFAVAQSKSKEK